jgi:hypothetical protein
MDPTDLHPRLHTGEAAGFDSLEAGNANALESLTRFLRTHWLKVLAISGVILTPCFWHRRIAASDLGSHLYNAWLVQLIERGQVHGLWIARQWNNVLFDYLLSGFGTVFSLNVAEKISVSIAVLLFFWGMFALVCAATGRAPWVLLPILAMFTYGWTFHMGFFNYYLSLGLSFFGIAIFWRGRGWERLLAFAIAPLVFLAHPLGLLWLFGASAYVGIAEIIARRHQVLLFLCAAGSLFGVHQYFWHHYVVEASPFPFYSMNGTDQLVLFGERYQFVAWAVLAFAIVSLGVDVIRRWREASFWHFCNIPLQLLLLALLAVPLLPRGVHFPDKTAAIALLTERLTSVTAAIGCCLLGAMRPSKWHLAGSLTIAAVFFAFLFQDTGVVNNLEAQAEQLVRTLPPNQRVLATILPLSGSRILIQHIIDRACIGHCFSYGNYEPGSGVFRVRALPGNSYVLSDYDLVVEMEEGDYTMLPEDLPAYQVYQCTPDGLHLCIRALEEDEDNDRLGAHPDN